MSVSNFIAQEQAFVFGFDDVVYPQKDYLLQVYYLFSEFMAYSEQQDSHLILQFMQQEFVANGPEQLFEKTAGKFNLPAKYAENFEKLHKNARLPLKLLLYKQVLDLMQQIVVDRKKVFLLVEGDIETQLNKIKQLEWNNLEQYLHVYFVSEYVDASLDNAFENLKEMHGLKPEEVLIIGNSQKFNTLAEKNDVRYLSVNELI